MNTPGYLQTPITHYALRITHYVFRFLTTLAGTPTTIVLGGTSRVTRLQAATTELSPMVTPFMIMHRLPNQTRLPMTTGSASMFQERSSTLWNVQSMMFT